MESTLFIFAQENEITAQLQWGQWSNDYVNWENCYRNLKNVEIRGNYFYSDLFTGEFVTYDEGSNKKFGIKTSNPWYPL